MTKHANAVHDAERLAELQELPLERKIQITQARIIEWYQHYNGNVVVSFSGGKDSTVLLHLVRRLYPNVRAVFSNTGLEYPEIQRFVRSFDNVDIVTPSMRFDEVIATYGYPLISKEVAEAIYYARRIRSQTVQVERESRSRDSAKAQRATWKTVQRKRAELSGTRRIGRDWKSGGGQTDRLIQTSVSRNRRTVLSGRMPGAGIGNGKTGEEGVFSKPKEQFGEKSMFNKEKYLPLARDVPVLISHYCCQKMKKQPMKKYQHKAKLYPILGTLAEESRVRKQAWLRHGCNAFESASPTSQPLSFWTEQDVLAYIVYYDLPIAPVYGDIVTVDVDGNQYNAREMIAPCGKLSCSGCDRTGCIFCAFGAHNEKGITRFQRIVYTHPKQYEFCIGGGGEWIHNPYYDPIAPVWDGEWKNWNPKWIWSRSGKGLGMGKVFDMVNEIYGKDFYRYE